MRTTITVADDVEAAIEQLRRKEGMGLSEAFNTLARRGMARTEPTNQYEHRVAAMGMKVDVSNIGDVLDLLEEEAS